MKIKRFEASSMSDALRAVKKDFGDNAVILSAKTVKKSNRIFGGKRKTQVVVTAAIDREASVSGAMTAQPESSAENQTFTGMEKVSEASKNNGFVPITRTGQKKLKSKFVRLASEIQRSESVPSEPPEKSLFKRLTDQGLEETIARDWSRQVLQLLSTTEAKHDENEERSALSQVIEAGNLAAPGNFPGHGNDAEKKQRRIVLVGPSGSGKTTMSAKLAASAAMQSQSAAVLSLDNYRIAGTEELMRYARIIGFQFQAPSGPEEINAALAHCRDDDVIIVDTPGFGMNDTATLQQVTDMVSQIDGAEVHLLLNAGVQHCVMAAMLDFFKPLGVVRLLFTHLDWVKDHGQLFNLAINTGLPISYLSTTSEVPDGFQQATAGRLVNLLLPAAFSAEKSTTNDGSSVTVIRSAKEAASHGKFLANRNSDIFHRPDCRSVQRINDNNILMFENELDAMAQSYKPCRMCCHDLLVPKPINAMAYRTTRTTARGRYS
jgi:flagellar biosynthetic protein FlhF